MPRRLTPQQEQELNARLQADPRYQAAMRIQNPQQRSLALMDLMNTPGAPGFDLNRAPSRGRQDNGAYRIDNNGRLQWVQTGPSSYFNDPGGIGRDAVIATATAGTMGWLPGMQPPPAAGGVPSMPWTNPPYGAAPPAGAIPAGLPAATSAAAPTAMDRVLRGLRDYGPAALAALPVFTNALGNRGPSDTEQQLNDIMGLAKKRIEGAEPLYQQLLAGAGEDATLARSRTAQGAPLLQALTAMANAQVPDAYRKG